MWNGIQNFLNASASINDLNESMISTESDLNPQDLDRFTTTVTQEQIPINTPNPTYIKSETPETKTLSHLSLRQRRKVYQDERSEKDQTSP
jgi:hypothetical protein